MPDLEKGTHLQLPQIQCPSVGVNEANDNALANGGRNSTLSSHALLEDPPDCPQNARGIRPYLTVFGAFLALFCTLGQMNSFGTYQTWYATHQLDKLSPSTISWIGSLQLWVFFFSGGPIGRLFDKYGPTGLMASGTIIYSLAIMMTSISTQYYQYILCQGILFGLGVGLMFYPSLASVSTHFSKYRATALGIAVAGSSIGGVVYPIMLQRLFGSLNFGWGVRVSGLVSGVCCAAATLIVTSLPSPKTADTCTLNIKTFADSRYVLLAIGSSFVSLGLYIPFFYIVEYAHQLSIAPRMSFYVLAIMNAGGFFGRVSPAYLSDSVGRFNLLMPSAFFSGLACLVFWMFAKSLVAVMLFAVVYGFFSGAFISVITPCIAQISDIRQIGTRIGMLYSIISFPSLIGGPAAGALLVRGHGNFDGMIAFSGATLIAGSFFILLSKLEIDPHIFARV